MVLLHWGHHDKLLRSGKANFKDLDLDPHTPGEVQKGQRGDCQEGQERWDDLQHLELKQNGHWVSGDATELLMTIRESAEVL